MKFYTEQGDILDFKSLCYYGLTAVVIMQVHATTKLGPLLSHGAAVEILDISEEWVQEMTKL